MTTCLKCGGEMIGPKYCEGVAYGMDLRTVLVSRRRGGERRKGKVDGAIRVKPRHKFNAQPTVVDGIRFASIKESRRYGELKLLEKAGEIHGLVLQPRFVLLVPDRRHSTEPQTLLGEYRADFAYCECRCGARRLTASGLCDRTRVVVEDVKGFKTPLYRWKKKHVEAQYGIKILET